MSILPSIIGKGERGYSASRICQTEKPELQHSPGHAIRDIVTDTLEALASVLNREGVRVSSGQCALAEEAVRQVWGGARVYVAKMGSVSVVQKVKRDRAIAEADREGVRIPEIASRFGLTPRRIKQILAEQADCKKTEIRCVVNFLSNS